MTYTRAAMKKNKRKKERKNRKKDWHVTSGRKEFKCCLWLWILLRVWLFHYLFFFLCFSHLIEKLISPNSQKSNILLTENDNLKHETIFVFVKFANYDNWIFSPESPVEKYVHFQAFTSCLIPQIFYLSYNKPKNPMDNKIDCKSDSSNLTSGNSFCFFFLDSWEKNFILNTNKQTTKLVW